MMLLALLLAAGTATPTCGMARPALCGTTNQLMWAKGTEAAMQAFFANARGDF
jgi:hypothetical protein